MRKKNTVVKGGRKVDEAVNSTIEVGQNSLLYRINDPAEKLGEIAFLGSGH